MNGPSLAYERERSWLEALPDASALYVDGAVLVENARWRAFFGEGSPMRAEGGVGERVIAAVRGDAGARPGVMSATYPDGGKVFVELQPIRLVDVGDEGLQARWVILRDVTWRESALSALADREETVRALVDASGEIVVFADREGRVQAFMGGVVPGPVRQSVGRTLPEILVLMEAGPPGIIEDAAAAVARCVSEDVAQLVRFHSGMGGRRYHFDVRIVPRGKDGMLFVAADATARRSEDLRRARQEQLVALGSVTAGVAHELNNPLTTVLGWLEHTSELLAEPEPPMELVKRHVIEALAGAKRVARIARDLQQITQDGTHADEASSTELRSVVEAMARMAEPQLRGRARLVLDLEQLPEVVGSAGRLGQVVLNLLVNAAQAIPEGEGEADGHFVRVRLRRGETGALLAVSDTGVGMTDEVVSRVFDPFFSTRVGKGGTGLGLAIAHRIINEVGGQVDVFSAPGRGSSFRCELPFAVQQAPPLQRPEQRGRIVGAPRRILVLDDDAAVAEVLAMMLFPHRVQLVETGERALQVVVEDGRFDVVFCDVMMPGMSGVEWVSRLRTVAPALVRRVVFITGGATTEPLRRALAELVNMQIAKPFSRQDVLRAVETIVELPDV